MSSIDNNKQETEYEIIKRAKDEFSVNKFVMMFSGGKDSLTTAHFLYDKLDIDFELLYCDTGIGLKENRDYVKSISKKYGWKLNIVDPLPHETYEIFIKRFGFPYGGIHQVIMGFLKYHPMRKWYREQRKLNPEVKIGLCSGRRRLESARRKKMKSNRPILDTEKMIFICPIYYWSDKQVWDYIKTEKLGLCSVYDTLHISGDCLCGAYGTQDEYDLMKIFHKDTSDIIISLENKYKKQWGGNIKHHENEKKEEKVRSKQTKISNFENLACYECAYYHDNK